MFEGHDGILQNCHLKTFLNPLSTYIKFQSTGMFENKSCKTCRSEGKFVCLFSWSINHLSSVTGNAVSFTWRRLWWYSQPLQQNPCLIHKWITRKTPGELFDMRLHLSWNALGEVRRVNSPCQHGFCCQVRSLFWHHCTKSLWSPWGLATLTP